MKPIENNGVIDVNYRWGVGFNKTFLCVLFIYVISTFECYSNGFVKKYRCEDDGFCWYELETKEKYMSSIGEWLTTEPYGAMDVNGHIIVPRQFEFIYYYDEHFYVEKNRCKGIYTKSGECLISTSRGYDNVYVVEENGYIHVEKGGKEGLCDLTGNEIISPSREYDNVSVFKEEGYIHVEKRGKEGLCDLTGNEIISPSREYDNVSVFKEEGYISVEKGGKKGLCDLTGNEIISSTKGYNRIDFWSNNYITAEKDDFTALYYEDGNEVIPIHREYRYVFPQCDTIKNYVYFTVVKPKEYRGICATDGTELVPPSKFEDCYFLRSAIGDYYVVRQNGFVGILRADQSAVIPPNKYKYASIEENNGTYWVRIVKDNMCGVADITGKVVIAPKYQYKSKKDGDWSIHFDETKNRFVYKQVSLNKEITLNYSLRLFKGKDPKFGYEPRIMSREEMKLLAAKKKESNTLPSSPSLRNGNDGPICTGTYVQSDVGYCVETQSYTPSTGSQWVSDVAFYEDHIIVGGAYCPLRSTTSSGIKIYDAGGLGNYEVSPNYSMKLKHFGSYYTVIYNMSLQGSLSYGSGNNLNSQLHEIRTGNNGGSVPVISNSLNDSSGSNNGDTQSRSGQNNRYGNKDCHSCLGSGVCSTCNGKGWIRHGLGLNTQGDCPNCENGRCSSCGGDGVEFRIR